MQPIAQKSNREPLLLTLGPVTNAPGVKQAMRWDPGSRDEAFIALSERVRERLLALGFETLLPDELQAPIIVTFRTPAGARCAERTRRRERCPGPGRRVSATGEF